MKLYREEQFGPVVPVMPFESIETAWEYIITSEHGQQVSIFSADADRVGSLVDPLVNQSAGSTSTASASAVRTCFRSPDEKFGGGHAVGDRCPAVLLDPLDGRDEADGEQQAASRHHRAAPQVQLHQYSIHLLSGIGRSAGVVVAIATGTCLTMP